MLARIMPLSVLSEGIEVLVPIGMGLVIDHGIIAGSLPITLLGVLAIIVVRQLGLWMWIAVFLGSQEGRMKERHRLRVVATAAALDPRSTPTERPAGEVLSIATSDADRASDLLDMVPWAFPASAVVLGVAVWFLVLDVWLGVALLLGIVALVVVIRVVTPALSRRYDDQQSEAAEAAATATDLVQGLRVLQGLGVQSRARARYRERSRIALAAALRNARFSGVSSGLTTLVTAVMLAAVVVLAARHTLAGAMTLGTLIAVVGTTRSIMGQLQGLSGVPVWWAGISTSARRVRDLLADYGWTVDDPRLAELAGADDAEGAGVRRGAAGGLRIAGARAGGLRGLDLEVRDGEVVALVADDAADADALVEVLAGASPGARVGRTAVDAARPGELREDLLVEPHRVDLFDGTLRDQLATRSAVAPSAADDSWATDALAAAGAEDLLRILPDGLDARILDRGANLSGGQRQRVALARAVASDIPVLVLQDPTTAVDAVTEQRIAEGLVAARRLPDRATLVLTRAPAILREADRVVFVRDGVVEAQGAHTELMRHDDYREAVQR
ncbi:ABC transporter ATP-binding protein [Brachybacterium huguangmaarense]